MKYYIENRVEETIEEMKLNLVNGLSLPDAAAHAIMYWDSLDDLNLLGEDGISAVIAEAIKISKETS